MASQRGTFALAASLVVSILATTPARADPPTDGAAALARARAVLDPIEDKSMKVTMRVIGTSGDQRTKVLRGYEKHGKGTRRVLWVFDQPFELQGTGFLAWENVGEADSLWAYFPGQRRVRRVPPSLRREKFQGSLFTYEDLIAIFFLDYAGQHKLQESESCGSRQCLVVESTLTQNIFAYDRLRIWLDRETFLPMRMEFYNQELLKVMTTEEIQEIDGIPTITRMKMSSPSDGFTTRVDFEKIAYNTDLRDKIFTVGYLSELGK